MLGAPKKKPADAGFGITNLQLFSFCGGVGVQPEIQLMLFSLPLPLQEPP